MDFFEKIENGDVNGVRMYLEDPDFDVNVRDTSNREGTALHGAIWCAKHRPENPCFVNIIEMLLKHPRIDVNAVDICGETPLGLSGNLQDFSICKMMLKEERVDVNYRYPGTGATLLWMSVFLAYEEDVKWILVLRDDVLMTEGLHVAHDQYFSPRELSEHKGTDAITAILDQYEKDKPLTRRNLQFELKCFPEMNACMAAQTFLLVRLLKEGFFRTSISSEHKQIRGFLEIAMKLPSELQTILCNLIHGIDINNFIPESVVALELRVLRTQDKFFL